MAIATTAQDAEGWRAFIRLCVGCAVASLLAGAAAIVVVDPLWVFRREPPWLAWTGGMNRLLDVEMRRAKPLQLASRDPGTLLVGSSVMYRGIDPAGIGAESVFNFGLSSLMADELPAIAALIAARPAIRRVLIGLDDYAFTDFAGPPPLRAGAIGPLGRAADLAGAALSLRSLAATLPGALASAYEPGAWHRDGFKSTPAYPSAVTLRLAAQEGSRRLAYRPDKLAGLALALDRLRDRDVRLYLSPRSGATPPIAGDAAWRRDVAALAGQRGLALLDLSDDHPFGGFDPARGSSAAWIDGRHFAPLVGRWVLERTGMAGPAAGPGSRRTPVFRP